MGGFVMQFEEKKFCKLETLAHRWDMSHDRIYELFKKDIIKPWHPEKKVGKKGILVDVRSVLQAESNGYLDFTSIE